MKRLTDLGEALKPRARRGQLAVFRSMMNERPSWWRRATMRLWASAAGVLHWRAGDEGLAVAFALTGGMCGVGVLCDLVLERLDRRWWRPLYSIAFAWIVQSYYARVAWWSTTYWDGAAVVIATMWFMGEADSPWIFAFLPVVVLLTSSTDATITLVVMWYFHPSLDYLRSSLFVPPCGPCAAIFAVLVWACCMVSLFLFVGNAERTAAREGVTPSAVPSTTVPYTFVICRKLFDHKYLSPRPYSAVVCASAVFILPTLILTILRQDVRTGIRTHR